MGKLKLIGSEGQRVFIRKLVDTIITEVGKEYGTNPEMNNHLINSIMNLIETEIYYSKFSKDKFDKKQILYLALNEIFKGEYQDAENKMIEEAVRYIFDNKKIIIYTRNFFFKYGIKAIKLAKDLIM